MRRIALRWPSQPGWGARLLDLAAVIGVFVGVPLAVWWQVPILAWLWLWGFVRVVPPWVGWGGALLVSAHLATLGGWSWGVALALCATVVALRHWVAKHPGQWRWVAEVCGGVIWALVATGGTTPGDSLRSFLVLLLGIASILLLRERESV